MFPTIILFMFYFKKIKKIDKVEIKYFVMVFFRVVKCVWVVLARHLLKVTKTKHQNFGRKTSD